MMAGKLSRTGWRASFLLLAAAVSLAAQLACAEGEIQVNAPSNVIENPFVTSKPGPQPAAEAPQAAVEAPQPAKRGLTTYQNPFANMSKAPPMDTSLRPGPVSRWQRPNLPHDVPSAVKSAVISQPIEPTHIPWDQLPPAENLRQRAAAQSRGTDPTFYDRLAGPDQLIRFTPTPLAQPSWLTVEAAEVDLHPSVGVATFNEHLNANARAERPEGMALAGPAAHTSGQVAMAFAIDSVIAPPESDDVLPTVVSDCPDTADGWLAQAQQAATSAESADELSGIIDLCDRGIRGAPSSQLLSSLRRLSAWAHNRRGEVNSDAQRPDDAINDFQAAISMDPTCSLAIHNRAVTFAQRNQFAAALRDFNRVIELNPGLAVAYRNRAELLAALGRMEEAVDDYSKAIESMPEDATLLRGRAHAYQRLGDVTRATKDINLAIDLSPHDPDAFTQRGNLAAEHGKFDRAQQDFRQAIAIDPSWAEAYRSLAWLQATCPDRRFRNAQQALAAAEQAAQFSPPDDYPVLDTLAAANACAGQFDKAIQIQRKAVAAAPRELSTSLEQRLALYQRGQAYSSAPAQSGVRTASHEVPTSTNGPRRSPTARQAPR